jgi:hypothetical protein
MLADGAAAGSDSAHIATAAVFRMRRADGMTIGDVIDSPRHRAARKEAA